MNIHTLAQTHVMTIISVSGTVRHCISERNKINVDFKLTYVDEYIKELGSQLQFLRYVFLILLRMTLNS